ncbi:putative calcium-binding protein CML41 [Hibiscus syriacus]|uniref:Calcium-binding protein CML41 n=1 Tax=Hibiscus syriacus TaxID=106335 RepID=A0A6A2Z1R9_HIBSY|nr:probable calcium-binding protein CML41 [Hibiscus syriacus]KAE8685380.1 putative calcium-binding protein CML41 [Hibiscus syriacus]
MATAKVSKASKWFSNKTLRLSLHRRRSKSSPTPTFPESSPSPPRKTPKRPYEEMKEVFRYFDGDDDGKISALELRAYFGSIGEYMSHEDAQAVINELDSDGDSMLDYQDFLKLMKVENRDDDDDLKRAFEMFELEKGSGCITPKGLQMMLNRLGDAKSYDECVAMIQVYDIDGNGVLDFYEFHEMMA